MCTRQLSSSPGPSGVGASARMADVIAFCVERNAEASKICTKFTFDPAIKFAGCQCDFASAAQHVGAKVSTGHYVAIAREGDRGYIRFDDGFVRRMESHEAAWSSIDREPTILVYDKREHTAINELT